MPLNGQISGFNYLPGKFYPVNSRAMRLVTNLFIKNERLISWITTTSGAKVAMIKVGACCVGRIKIFYSQYLEERGYGAICSKLLAKAVKLNRGDCLGTFEMGSTVILLFPPGVLKKVLVKPGEKVQMGQSIAIL